MTGPERASSRETQEPKVDVDQGGALDLAAEAERLAAEAKAESEAKAAAAAAAAAAKAESEKNPTYVVAPGQSIMCPRGHLDAGTPVAARDLVVNPKDEAAGQKELDDFIARGAVVRS
jgi:regulator of protease activity HflC (stomatin/prohibitin superfamily)